ncbi:MAG: DHA2 family efflux MFS transporter permease subunit [Sphingomonadales bacterium]|nr:DHA2 family efflux MFS transporter permease subunit [Sphingomonadales bacterium]
MAQHITLDPARRAIITGSVLLGSMMVVIDSTIASVALPHVQAATGASTDQIIWVLTSYMIATAIAMPLSGWLATRFGRKRVILASLAGFTLASMLCGVADDLATLVVARALQGASGAGLQPLSQAALLDANPRENHARVLAIQGMASMIGPLFGPTLGGWLTDTLSWRWVFFINLPLGALALFGVAAFLPGDEERTASRFDLFGFAALSLAVAALQLLLDRGPQLDWLDSGEIRLWLVVVAVGLWFTVVHTLTGTHTFVRRELFRDWNFVVTSIFGTLLCVAAFGSQPLTTFWLQKLLGYTALRAGSLIAVASLSSLLSVLVLSGPLVRIGPRFLMAFGLVLMGWSQIMYARLDLTADQWPFIAAGLVKGAGVGLVFTVLPGLTYATLDAGLRNEGAAFNALVRNMGMSVGISLMQILALRTSDGARSGLVATIRRDNAMLDYAMPWLDPNATGAVARIDGMIARQATVVGYVEAFMLAGVVAFALIPLVLLMRVRR